MTKRFALRLVLLVAALACPTGVAADVYRPAYLELSQRDAETYDVVWRVPARGDRRLGQYGHAVHGIGDRQAVPVNAGFLRQVVGHRGTQRLPLA